jgi:hypothetical protein
MGAGDSPPIAGDRQATWSANLGHPAGSPKQRACSVDETGRRQI